MKISKNLKRRFLISLCFVLIAVSGLSAQDTTINEVAKLIEQGEQAYRANNLAEADRLFTQAIELEDAKNIPSVFRNHKAYLGLSLTLAKRHPYRSTQAMLRWFNLEASSAEAYRAFAAVPQGDMREQDRLDLNHLTEAILLEPANPENYMRRAKAVSYYTTLVLEDYERLIEAAPNYAPVYLERGFLQASRGEYQVAVADYDKYIALNPQGTQLYYLRRGAALLFRDGATSDAMQNLTKAIEGTDSNLRGESFYYRGWGHFLARNIPQAQADMTEAAKVDPKKKEDFYYRITFDAFPDKKFKNTKSVRNAIGELYDKKGWQERELNFQKFKIYTAAVSSLPEEENWMFERVEATVNIPDNPGNVHLDISSLKKYQALAGARNRVHTELQRVLNKRIAALGINMERPFDTPSRNTYFALYNRTNAHGFDPRNIAANITRAEQKIKDRDYHSAIALLNKVLQVEPNNIPALEQRMRAFLFKRAFIRADAEAERILRAQPKNALAMNVRGLFNFEAQNMNAALDYFNRAVAAAPSDPRPLFNRARVYTVKSDYPAALKDFERLRQLAPDVSDYVAGRGNVYYAMKEWEEAALNYMEAVVLDERNFTARINLVRALDQAGQSELADKQHDWLIKNAGDLPALKALEKRNAELVKKSSTEVEEAKSMQKMGGLLAEIDNDSKVIISILKAKPAETKSEAINRLTDARRRIYNIISGSSQIEYMAREMLKTGGSRSPALRQKLEKLLYAAQQFKAVAEEHKVKCEAALKSLQGYL